ncbi:MAG: hydrogenase maturation nickel metallochaperone HypA [Bacillota bacterium]
MHEYSITKQIVKMADAEAQTAGGKRILEIRIAAGELSTYVDESIQMYFDIISAGTLAQGAKLVFRRIPAEFFCGQCGENFIKPKSGFECPKCGNVGSRTENEAGFYIESLEVED